MGQDELLATVKKLKGDYLQRRSDFKGVSLERRHSLPWGEVRAVLRATERLIWGSKSLNQRRKHHD
jgi:hypothetical protein